MRSVIAHGWDTDQAQSAIPAPNPTLYPEQVPTGLKRYQTEGDDHLITFSCYRRLPFLYDDRAKTLFQSSLEQLSARHSFEIHAYVVMPEHVHLLLSEPARISLSTALNILKTQTARHLKGDHQQFWQTRYHDVNILTHRRWRSAVHYIHRNPVKRGLVDQPEDWPWSSYRHWLTGETGQIEIESHWTWNQKQRLASAGGPHLTPP